MIVVEVLDMSKYYAVKKGRKTGIFMTWDECEKQVKGFSGAIYKSFTNKEDADDFINEKEKAFDHIDVLIAYVDGSFNKKSHEYGYGCVLIKQQKIIQKLSGKDNNVDYLSMHNVAGEILGSLKAIEYAIQNHYSFICIYYDYEGIEKWATRKWKANKKGTIEYQKKIEEYSKQIEISFIKVLAHSGDFYNEMADSLAKKAVGISG